MTIYNDTRLTLLKLTSQEREEMANNLAKAKTGAIVGVVAGAFIGTLGVFGSSSSPVANALTFSLGVGISIMSREFYVILQNSEEVMNSLVTRTKVLVSADSFINQALKETWIVKSLMGPTLKREFSKIS